MVYKILFRPHHRINIRVLEEARLLRLFVQATFQIIFWGSNVLLSKKISMSICHSPKNNAIRNGNTCSRCSALVTFKSLTVRATERAFCSTRWCSTASIGFLTLCYIRFWAEVLFGQDVQERWHHSENAIAIRIATDKIAISWLHQIRFFAVDPVAINGSSTEPMAFINVWMVISRSAIGFFSGQKIERLPRAPESATVSKTVLANESLSIPGKTFILDGKGHL